MKDQNLATPTGAIKACSIKQLDSYLQADAVKTAVAIDPENAVALPSPGPLRTTVNIKKQWSKQPRTLSVSFMQYTPDDLRDKILAHMNAWSKTCGISFKATSGVGQVRISFGPGGYWSYLGTDILHIAPSQPTMNLEGFSMETEDSEFYRVVRHETGHTLGFEHEHMRQELVDMIDPDLAYAYFLKDQGWDRATVDQQVLTPLDKKSILGTPADTTSIMCYQLPGEIMRNGKGIPGGKDINATDYAFAAQCYPKAAAAPPVAAKAMPATTRGAAKAMPAMAEAAEMLAAPQGGIRFSPELIADFNQATLH